MAGEEKTSASAMRIDLATVQKRQMTSLRFDARGHLIGYGFAGLERYILDVGYVPMRQPETLQMQLPTLMSIRGWEDRGMVQ